MWPFWRRWLSPPVLLLLLLASTAVLADESSSSARARRLAQGPPRGRSNPTEHISLEDILAGIDLSKGPKAVEVQLAPADSQRPAVVVSVKISDLFPDEGLPHPQGPAQTPPTPPGSGRKLNGQHTQPNSKLLQAPTAQAAAAGPLYGMADRKLLLQAAAGASSIPAASSQQLSWSQQDLNQGHHASQRKLAQRPSGIEGWLQTASNKDLENYKALQESVRGSSSGSGRSSTRPSIADVSSPGHRRLLAAQYGRADEHGSSSSSSKFERNGVQPQTGFQLFARKLAAAGVVPASITARAALSATSGTAVASATAENSRTSATASNSRAAAAKPKDEQVNAPVKPSNVGDAAVIASGNRRSAAAKPKDEQISTPVKPSTVGDAAVIASQLEPSPLVKATGAAADETPRSTRRDDLSHWAEGAPVDAQKGLAEIGATKLTAGRQNVKLTDLGLDPKP